MRSLVDLYTKKYTKASGLDAFFVSYLKKRSPIWEKPDFDTVHEKIRALQQCKNIRYEKNQKTF
jgi:hypothetical protein